MKIAFLGLSGTFDYSQIGGTDSYIRRLIDGLLNHERGFEISCIFYNSDKYSHIKHGPRFTSKYFPTFKDALHHLAGASYFHVISAYLLPRDRLKFARFRNKNNNVKFHNIVFFYPDSKIKRFMKFSEYYFYPYNGKIFCVSRRQYNNLKKIKNDVVYLPPPVPEDYFLSPFEKPENEKINITYLGRIDPRKGIEEVIQLFEAVSNNPLFQCEIYGIVIRQDNEALKIYNWLRRQDKIEFIEIHRGGYSAEVNELVKHILKKTDIFIQPYKTFDSTVDSPLLLLEAMASLCAVITTPFGNIPDIYGYSDFIVAQNNILKNALNVLHNISLTRLKRERERIYARNATLPVRSKQVVEKFINALE